MAIALQDIHKGMSVEDQDGQKIGTVEFVHFSDEDFSTPEAAAATASPATQDERTSAVHAFAEALKPSEMPEQLRQRLLREGFVRIDAKGLFASDRFATPDQIAVVEDDRVKLAVGKDDLIKREH